MTLPKGHGKASNPPAIKQGGKEKKIAAGVGVTVAALLVLSVVGASQSNNTANMNTGLPAISQTPSGTEEMRVRISYGSDHISRGSTQMIGVSVTGGDGSVPDAAVIGIITYPSGSTKGFTGMTDSTGEYRYKWRIGAESDTGTFNVDVTVIKNGQTIPKFSSFTVTES